MFLIIFFLIGFVMFMFVTVVAWFLALWAMTFFNFLVAKLGVWNCAGGRNISILFIEVVLICVYIGVKFGDSTESWIAAVYFAVSGIITLVNTSEAWQVGA
jgi:hypothetical protein